jgi:hypothetical protein
VGILDANFLLLFDFAVPVVYASKELFLNVVGELEPDRINVVLLLANVTRVRPR